MSKKFDGKVVIVTGSSAGIGQAAAVEFGKEGALLVIHGQNQDRLNICNLFRKTESMLLDEGIDQKNILKVIGSMEDASTPAKIVEETIKKFGKIDVLINNAGAAGSPKVHDPYAIETLEFLYQVNFKSVVLLTQLCYPHLEKSKGNIVNVSSIASLKPFPTAPFYAAMKAALDNFTKNCAHLYGPKGVRVNALNPGPIKTFIIERNNVPGLQDKFDEYAVDYTSLHRYGTSTEMANTLKFLASEDASYITGAILIADGGMTLYSPKFPI
uniref:Uncharacterized protein n=2 Tax=Ditylenchus dipsaci TaxID=166011 RepID=A0A915DS42_9BILA